MKLIALSVLLLMAACNPADSAPVLTYAQAKALGEKCKAQGLEPVPMHFDTFYDTTRRVRWVWCKDADGNLFEQSQELP